MTPYCQTIEALCDADQPGRALALTQSMAEALESKDRAPDARALIATLVQRGAHNDKVAQQLFDYIEKQDGSEEWYGLIREKAQLSAANLTAESLANYEKFRCFTKGHVVFHPAGWGEGMVTEFRNDSAEIVIDFVNGRARDLPLQAAIESMKPLPADDLRAMRILAKDKLEEMAKEDPSQLIRLAAKLFRGKITSTKVKESLTPSVIPTKKWNTFWKKAKAAAAHDPWLQVEGSTTRPVFVLRKKPLGLAEEARNEVRFADDLGNAIEICRNYLARCHDENATNTILDLAQEVVEDALNKAATGEKQADAAQLLDGILLLAEHGRQTSVTPAEELKILLHENESFQPENIDKLATQEAREHAIAIIHDALGDNWAQTCAAELPRFSASVVEKLTDRLIETKQAHLTLPHWETVAPYPRRHPMLSYLMGCMYADGHFDGREGCPDPTTVGRVLLHLLRTLTEDRKGDIMKGRLQTRVASLLTGRREFLSRILEDISKEDCAAYYGITERGGSDFPQEVSNLILRTVAKRYPEIIAKPEKPFWELDFNYVTKEGLARQKEEYRILVEEKIPANSKAIGVAASHGDLSENSEWDAAMEEQRNLTGRAETMNDELSRAKLIEDQTIPNDTVAPGTRVTYTDLTDDRERCVRMLGPWDVTSDDILNYKAPLGQAMLGMRPGQVTSLEMGGVNHELRIDNVEPI